MSDLQFSSAASKETEIVFFDSWALCKMAGLSEKSYFAPFNWC